MSIFKLTPVCKDYIWGGTALIDKYGKITDGITRVGEISLEELLTEENLGKNASNFDRFPMLVKLIDAKKNLSVQVHPSDDYALENENSYGKTEMWYIVEADESAGIYLGFSKEVTKDEVKEAIESNTLCDLLKFYPVKAGEAYFIPAGTVHAIGAGCLICEIQQNSNLTYRVYDYGRKDKNGNERELHVEKALKVTNLSKYEYSPLAVNTDMGTLLGLSRYFTTTSVQVDGSKAFYVDNGSFKCAMCVEGEGEIAGKKVSLGDSWFIPAGYGEVTVSGKMHLIIAEVRKYYVGIDLGGTFIKGGIVDDLGHIICEDKTPTESEKGAEGVATNIANLAKRLMAKVGLEADDMEGLGMGVPGMIDSKAGNVIYSNNLKWKDFQIGETVSKLTGLKVKIANDANVAALGEVKFGAAKEFDDAVLLTLGTGVGGGIVVDGKLVEGNKSAGAELGHMVIECGGEQCTCGRKGCLEAYASATALIRDTKRAMEAHKDSKMWEIGSLDNVSGKVPFDYKTSDPYAKEVVDNYIAHLACGITNVANIFRPQTVLLGGGVCAQGDALVKPLQALVDKEIFAGDLGPNVPIRIAQLGNSAGLLGAAALLMD